MSDLEAELAAVPNMSASELTDCWAALGRGSAPRVPLRVLRRALLRFLSRFLEETLHEFEIPDLPDRNDYISFQEWNADCLAHFERLEMRMTAIIARYEAILDGREPHDVLPAPTGIVIKGPWGRSNA